MLSNPGDRELKELEEELALQHKAALDWQNAFKQQALLIKAAGNTTVGEVVRGEAPPGMSRREKELEQNLVELQSRLLASEADRVALRTQYIKVSDRIEQVVASQERDHQEQVHRLEAEAEYLVGKAQGYKKRLKACQGDLGVVKQELERVVHEVAERDREVLRLGQVLEGERQARERQLLELGREQVLPLHVHEQMVTELKVREGQALRDQERTLREQYEAREKELERRHQTDLSSLDKQLREQGRDLKEKIRELEDKLYQEQGVLKRERDGCEAAERRAASEQAKAALLEQNLSEVKLAHQRLKELYDKDHSSLEVMGSELHRLKLTEQQLRLTLSQVQVVSREQDTDKLSLMRLNAEVEQLRGEVGRSRELEKDLKQRAEVALASLEASDRALVRQSQLLTQTQSVLVKMKEHVFKAISYMRSELKQLRSDVLLSNRDAENNLSGRSRQLTSLLDSRSPWPVVPSRANPPTAPVPSSPTLEERLQEQAVHEQKVQLLHSQNMTLITEIEAVSAELNSQKVENEALRSRLRELEEQEKTFDR